MEIVATEYFMSRIKLIYNDEFNNFYLSKLTRVYENKIKQK